MYANLMRVYMQNGIKCSTVNDDWCHSTTMSPRQGCTSADTCLQQHACFKELSRFSHNFRPTPLQILQGNYVLCEFNKHINIIISSNLFPLVISMIANN